jgi:hypothetical protein
MSLPVFDQFSRRFSSFLPGVPILERPRRRLLAWIDAHNRLWVVRVVTLDAGFFVVEINGRPVRFSAADATALGVPKGLHYPDDSLPVCRWTFRAFEVDDVALTIATLYHAGTLPRRADGSSSF